MFKTLTAAVCILTLVFLNFELQLNSKSLKVRKKTINILGERQKISKYAVLGHKLKPTYLGRTMSVKIEIRDKSFRLAAITSRGPL